VENNTEGLIPENMKNWSFRELEKKAPHVLENIMNKAPKLYEKMEKAEYGE
jgi:hypothetical protein